MDLQSCLQPTACVESAHPAVVDFVQQHSRDGDDPVAQSVALYYAVRDGFRYDPYRIDLTVDGMKASATLDKGYGWCVSKAILLAAACRRRGIPARLGFGDVRNHLSTERLRQTMKSDLFYWHGYTELWLNQRWVKATPAFNIELTRKFGLLPLEFDGLQDSIYHPFDASGARHMEYVTQRGSFIDLPLAEIRATFAEHYPGIWTGRDALQGADWDADVGREGR